MFLVLPGPMRRSIIVPKGVTVEGSGKTMLEPHGDPWLYLERSPFPGSIFQPLGLKISTLVRYNI